MEPKGNLGFVPDCANPEPKKTLRDEFAIAALKGIMASPDTKNDGCKTIQELAHHIAQVSYIFADAMMKQRDA